MSGYARHERPYVRESMICTAAATLKEAGAVVMSVVRAQKPVADMAEWPLMDTRSQFTSVWVAPKPVLLGCIPRGLQRTDAAQKHGRRRLCRTISPISLARQRRRVSPRPALLGRALSL